MLYEVIELLHGTASSRHEKVLFVIDLLLKIPRIYLVDSRFK